MFMELNEVYKKIKEEVLNNPTIKRDTNFAILSLHESATKLFTSAGLK